MINTLQNKSNLIHYHSKLTITKLTHNMRVANKHAFVANISFCLCEIIQENDSINSIFKVLKDMDSRYFHFSNLLFESDQPFFQTLLKG